MIIQKLGTENAENFTWKYMYPTLNHLEVNHEEEKYYATFIDYPNNISAFHLTLRIRIGRWHEFRLYLEFDGENG